MLKTLNIILLVVLVLCSTSQLYSADTKSIKLKTIVIDPGHGGRPGAIYGSYKEKDITLAVGLIFGKKIKEAFPEINVIYTRTDDTDVELHERSQIANDAMADLFMSIHANSATSASAAGTETYVMGYDKSDQNMSVAMKENQVVTYENDFEQKYEGFDPTSAESYILFSLMQYSYISQSTILASYIQKEFTSSTPMKDRGVKQGPFLVLWRATMPSILTEIGFLSNSSDRSYITSKAGQEQIAESLFVAFKNYKEYYENQSSVIETQPKESEMEVETVVKEQVQLKKTSESANIVFRVQVLSSDKKQAINLLNFGKYHKQTREIKEGNLYKYQVGECNQYKEALSLQLEIKETKFKDAFIVAFSGDEKISVSQAIKMLKN